MTSKLIENARDLEQELTWFRRILEARLKNYFSAEPSSGSLLEIEPPDLSKSTSEYAGFVRHYHFSFAERLAFVLGLVPHIRPQLLDELFTLNTTTNRRFTEFGGAQPRAEGEFWPTGETLAFILGGKDLSLRFLAQLLFEPTHFFSKHNILKLAPAAGDDAPQMKAPLRLSEDVLSIVTTGQHRQPSFGSGFPAQRIETRFNWDDVVLHPGTRKSIEEIQTWITHGETLMEDWGMGAKLRPGYRSLFYGPPGTGKTLIACLLGKTTGRDVYKVDISLVMSKYIGETEKNLGRVFDQAEHKGWILFFDEADALFGKRSETKDSHDRYANQEVSFLLQRIETFDGIAILASNLRDNLDDAFTRRFESIIYFPIPRPEERMKLWRQGFSPKARFANSVDLERIAREHALSGGMIMNVIRYVSLQALKEGGRPLTQEDLLLGIRREFAKEGKTG
ncbi:ATP-binding protein [Vitiosangium sp. GDMCC 1.1324]|uniref:ATP-binding protein n=1 Tax=Vitiosangium sp. (strain GDMCC 1.1324) TaxID=2138576 RepID=UPI000D382135|nr:ATP-binding protein [Vitiosangium sp. GDMCC 1.1324]PTL78087.1 AAA family ATPase [Vitiosangium sp. GDMCC 1.1324]